MRTRKGGDPITQLRSAIDCLPAATRIAMLAGVQRQPVVTGAYTDNDGGACPMLAAHRAGSRVSFLSFARAWDAFAGARRPRRATPREVTILISQLEASLLAENDGAQMRAVVEKHRDARRPKSPVDLGGAIAEHQATARRRRAREAATTPQPRWRLARRRACAGAGRRGAGTRRRVALVGPLTLIWGSVCQAGAVEFGALALGGGGVWSAGWVAVRRLCATRGQADIRGSGGRRTMVRRGEPLSRIGRGRPRWGGLLIAAVAGSPRVAGPPPTQPTGCVGAGQLIRCG